MLASAVLARVVLQLNDAGYVRWSQSELLLYLSEGQRIAAEKMPACTAKTAAVKLARGDTRHNLPSDAGILIDITRNLGANGSTPGKPITRMNRSELERFYPTWHSERGRAEIKHFDYDPNNPRQFVAFPRSVENQDVYVEAIYSVMPGDITDPSTQLTVTDRYADAMPDYVLHRAFDKDAEYAGEGGRSTKHLQKFYAGLGLAG